MINSKYLPLSLVSLGLIAVVSSYSNVFKKYLDNDNEEYDLIKEYLLNESPLYGNNRPKLWIHTKYELNARKWKDFSSRNSKDLNQDYLHLTIKTIIKMVQSLRKSIYSSNELITLSATLQTSLR